MAVTRSDAETLGQAVADALAAHEAIYTPTNTPPTLTTLHNKLAAMLAQAPNQWSGYSIQWGGSPKP